MTTPSSDPAVGFDPRPFAERRDSRRLTLVQADLRPPLPVEPSPQRPVEVRLDGDVDGDGQATLRVRCATEVELICQRCLEPLTLAVRSDSLLGLIEREDDAASLDDRYEPLLAAALEPAELAAAELLLALPLVPRHADPADCGPLARAAAAAAPAAVRPFAGLSDLLKD